MSELAQLFSTGLETANWQDALLTLLMAFALGKSVAATYEWTYEGLSYARSFVQSLVLGAVVSAMLMLAIGDNLARGLGIMGTMALVRFRTNVRDSRDMIFVFAALAVGVAVGVKAFPAALMGVLVFCASAVVVNWSPFARRHRFDGMLRFWLPTESADAGRLREVLSPHCQRFVLVALRDVAQGESMEYAYQVQLRVDAHEGLVKALSGLEGIGGLTLLLQDAHTEL